MPDVSFSFYKQLSPVLLDRSGIILTEPEFEFEKEGKILKISKSKKSTDDMIELPGADSEWTKDDEICVSCKCTVSKPNVFFDKKSGIAGPGTELGVAAVISSIKTSLRRTIHFDGSISEMQERSELAFSFRIPPKTVLDSFTMRFILYLKKTREDSVLPGYADMEGTVLAHVGVPITVMLDKEPNDFPTRVIPFESSKSHLLWKLETEWTDPFKDSFNDSVCLFLNSNHQRFESLNPERKSGDRWALSEIYAEAILQIIEKVKSEMDEASWKEILNLNPDRVEPDSVSLYVGYMLKTHFKTDGNNAIYLSEKIRNKLYSEMKR